MTKFLGNTLKRLVCFYLQFANLAFLMYHIICLNMAYLVVLLAYSGSQAFLNRDPLANTVPCNICSPLPQKHRLPEYLVP